MNTAVIASSKENIVGWRLGAFWLDYDPTGNEWRICWHDHKFAAPRWVGTSIGQPAAEIDKRGSHPPLAAKRALAAWFAAQANDENEPHWYMDGRNSCEASRKTTSSLSDLPSLSAIFDRWFGDHASRLARAEAYRYSIQHFHRFFQLETEGVVTITNVNNAFINRFIAFRRKDGVKGETIHGDLAALRSALNWAEREELIRKAPRVRELDPADRSPPRELEYSLSEVARVLEAAWRLPERRHVHLFILIMLSTHARVQAVLELDASQIRDGRIFFNASGRAQTRKKRSIVPMAPTLAPWLGGRQGRVIRYQVLRAERHWAIRNIPLYHDHSCADIGRAFDACLVEAGLQSHCAGSGRVRGLGSPNTLRHSIHTYLQARGVPQAQIDAAAGHSSEIGSGRNYTHLRPEYLADFIEAIEGYWTQMDAFTNVHRYLCSAK